MKINNLISTVSVCFGQLFSCCGDLSAEQQRVDSVREAIVEQWETRAVIDVGSGETKIAVCDVNPTTNQIGKVWHNTFVTVKLGRHLIESKDGCLSAEIEQQLMTTLKSMQEEVAQYQPRKWIATGTAVFRAAKNGQEVLDRVKEQTGIEVQILSQKDEGAVGFATVVATSHEEPENVMVWDNGANSFQITALVDGSIDVFGAEFSLNQSIAELYALRNSSAFINPISHEEAMELIERIRKKLPPLKPWLADKNKKVLGMGGGGASIFSDAAGLIGQDTISKADVMALIQNLCGKSEEDFPILKTRKHILVGLVLLYTLMDHCGFDKVEKVMTNGNCIGIAVTPHFWDEHYVDFVMVRHGETFWNETKEMQDPHNPNGSKIKGPIIQGVSDIELNSKGEMQAEEAADKIIQKKLSFKKIVTSDLKRAAKTADIIGKRIGLVPTQDTGFRACNWAECEGRQKEYRIEKFHYDANGNYRGSDPDWKKMTTAERWSFCPIPNAESSHDVIEKMKSAFSRIAEEMQDKDTILVVTHQENMKAFSRYCEMDATEKMRMKGDFEGIKRVETIPIANCSLHKIRYNRVTKKYSYLGQL